MVKACILLKITPTSADRILENLRKMKVVKKAYLTYGRWDVVALIDSSMDEVARISGTINGIDGVRTSETLPEA
jgi:DNA-binding Lrp family transcriptional regulator